MERQTFMGTPKNLHVAIPWMKAGLPLCHVVSGATRCLDCTWPHDTGVHGPNASLSVSKLKCECMPFGGPEYHVQICALVRYYAAYSEYFLQPFGKELSLYAAQYPTRAQISFTSRRKPEIMNILIGFVFSYWMPL